MPPSILIARIVSLGAVACTALFVVGHVATGDGDAPVFLLVVLCLFFALAFTALMNVGQPRRVEPPPPPRED